MADKQRNVALIVVDMQELFRPMLDKAKDNVTGNVVKLINASHEKHLPVFVTQHHDSGPNAHIVKFWNQGPLYRGSENWELIPEIKKCLVDEDTIIEKTTYDAFHDTDLNKRLTVLGVDTVVVSGVMTNICCETTARSAFVNNFNVIFPADGSATTTEEYQEATLMNIKLGFGIIQTCDEFISSLN